ncbi:hypothetical protein [Pseudoalteromonas sp. XMcav11-Q]|uniref:hypothetical protein n=1 Tax=Pseudoalteromonas sp. XMcav11-Q TaxID=3136665 RepID=UPI0032C48B76
MSHDEELSLAEQIEKEHIMKESVVNLTHAGISCFSGLRDKSLVSAICKGSLEYQNYLEKSLGKHLALNGGAVIASTILQLIFNSGDPTYKKLLEIEGQIARLQDRMESLFRRLENKIDLVPVKTTYQDYYTKLGTAWNKIADILKHDKTNPTDMSYIVSDTKSLVASLNIMTLEPLGGERQIVKTFEKLAAEYYFDDLVMHSHIINWLSHRCAAQWMQDLRRKISPLLDKKDLSDEAQADSIQKLIEQQVQTYKDNFNKLQKRSLDVFTDKTGRDQASILCNGLPSYFEENLKSAQNLSDEITAHCQTRFKESVGLKSYIEDKKLVEEMSSSAEGCANVIANLKEQYGNYEFFIVVNVENRHFTFQAGNQYTVCNFRNVAIGSKSKKNIYIAAVHRSKLSEVCIPDIEWPRNKRELYELWQRKKPEMAKSAMKLIKQDPRYKHSQEFSIAYGLLSGYRVNTQGIIKYLEDGSVAISREEVYAPSITQLKTRLYMNDSFFDFSMSAGLSATTGAIAFPGRFPYNLSFAYLPILHVFPTPR